MNDCLLLSALMNQSVIDIANNSSLVDLEQVFTHYPYSVIPVTHNRRLIGTVERSVFNKFVENIGNNRGSGNYATMAAQNIKPLINKNIIKLSTNNTVNEAIDLLNMGLYPTIPVVNTQDELVGIITQYDLVNSKSDDAPPSWASRNKNYK